MCQVIVSLHKPGKLFYNILFKECNVLPFHVVIVKGHSVLSVNLGRYCILFLRM